MLPAELDQATVRPVGDPDEQGLRVGAERYAGDLTEDVDLLLL